MALLTRDQILAAPDLPTEDVDVPEWGGGVRVRAMDGAGRDSFDGWLGKCHKEGNTSMEGIRANLVARCLVDESGNLLFSASDVEVLGRKSGAALDRVYAVATRLNRMRAVDVDDAAKNSASGQSDDSGTA